MIRNKYKTSRFNIQGYTQKDYKTWFAAYTSLLPKKSKFDRGPYKPSECKKEVFLKIVKRHQLLAKEGKTFIWGIFDKTNGKLVGAIDVHILVRGEIQKANLGYQIFNNYWRQGIASEVLSKLIPMLLVDLKINRLEAVIDTDNRASIRLAKTIGLRNEGIRKNYYFQDGDWADQIVYVADRKLFKLPLLKPE